MKPWDHQLYVFDKFFCRTKNHILWIGDQTDQIILIKITIKELHIFANAMTTAMKALVDHESGLSSKTGEVQDFSFSAGTKIKVHDCKVTLDGVKSLNHAIGTTEELASLIRAVSSSLPFLYEFSCEEIKILNYLYAEDCCEVDQSLDIFFTQMMNEYFLFDISSKIKHRYKYMNESNIYIFLNYYVASEDLKPYFKLHFMH